MRVRLLLIVAAAAVVIAGCGDDGASPPVKRLAQRTRPIAKPAQPHVKTRANVPLPAGSLRVKRPKLTAGSNSESLDLALTIDRPSPGARVEVRLPKLFVERSQTGLRFAGDPRLTSDAGGRVRLARKGQRVSLDVSSAQAGDSASITIPRLALPAGTYELPLT